MLETINITKVERGHYYGTSDDGFGVPDSVLEFVAYRPNHYVPACLPTKDNPFGGRISRMSIYSHGKEVFCYKIGERREIELDDPMMVGRIEMLWMELVEYIESLR